MGALSFSHPPPSPSSPLPSPPPRPARPAPPLAALGLPILEWTTAGVDPAPAFTVAGLKASSAFRVDGGPWAGGASVKRKGATSRLAFPKPKLRLSFPKPGLAGVWGPQDTAGTRSLDVNSLFGEVTGAPSSYVREVAAFQAYRTLGGVPAPRARHAVVVLNGDFWGLVALVERMDGTWLRRVREAVPGGVVTSLDPGPGALLFKPEDATWANLRPDADAAALRLAWKLAAAVGEGGEEAKNDKGTVDAAFRSLEAFSRLLADGGGPRRGRGPGGGGGGGGASPAWPRPSTCPSPSPTSPPRPPSSTRTGAPRTTTSPAPPTGGGPCCRAIPRPPCRRAPCLGRPPRSPPRTTP